MKRRKFVLAVALSVVVLLAAPSAALAFSDVPITHKYAGAIQDLVKSRNVV